MTYCTSLNNDDNNNNYWLHSWVGELWGGGAGEPATPPKQELGRMLSPIFWCKKYTATVGKYLKLA